MGNLVVLFVSERNVVQHSFVPFLQQGPGEQRSPTPESETTRMTRLIKEHEMKTSIEGKLKAAGIKLAHNQLQSLSGWNQVTVSILHNWDQLAYLDLSSNHLVNVPDEILSLPLEALYLHSNAIVYVLHCCLCACVIPISCLCVRVRASLGEISAVSASHRCSLMERDNLVNPSCSWP